MELTSRREIKNTGQKLTALGMGCASLGNLFQAISDDDARATIDAAWEAGIRLFDTAPFYGYSRSELRLGAALRNRPRSEFILSTKVGRLLKPNCPGENGHRAAGQDKYWLDPLPFHAVFDYTGDGIRRSVEDSLVRLGLSFIDIALVHDIGRATHGERHTHYWEQLTRGGGFKALEILKSEGLIGAIGLGVNEWEVIDEALQATAIDCALLAGRYTLLEQGARNFLDRAAQQDIAILIGGPFNSGILATGAAADAKFNYENAHPDIVRKVNLLQQVCQQYATPLAAAAVQFPLSHPAVVACLPGFKSAAELGQIKAWFEFEIHPELWRQLVERGLIPEPAQARGPTTPPHSRY